MLEPVIRRQGSKDDISIAEGLKLARDEKRSFEISHLWFSCGSMFLHVQQSIISPLE